VSKFSQKIDTWPDIQVTGQTVEEALLWKREIKLRDPLIARIP
jgi:hypothetical protein